MPELWRTAPPASAARVPILMRLWRKHRRGEKVRDLSDEERAALAAEREQRERAQQLGETYIRTYVEPATNWGRDRPTRDEDAIS